MPFALISPTGATLAQEIAITLSTGMVQRFDAVRRRKDGSLVDVSVSTAASQGPSQYFVQPSENRWVP